jgi:hypothetical protein
MSVPKKPGSRAALYVELVMQHAPSDPRFIELVTQRAKGVAENKIASGLGFDSPEELYAAALSVEPTELVVSKENEDA